MKWNRKEIINFCNKQVFPFVETWTGLSGELWEVVNMVHIFRRKNGYPEEMSAVVDDGFLFINDLPVGRIAPKSPTGIYDTAAAAYWENRILARQERYYD